MRKLLICAALATGASLGIGAQEPSPGPEPTLEAVPASQPEPPVLIKRISLAEADVRAAIVRGLAMKGGCAGLRLTDAGRGFMNAMSMMGNHPERVTTTSGFGVEVYTPLAWIGQRASDASKEYRTFGLSDVSDDMLEPVLRMWITPDTPQTVGRHDTRAANLGVSVEHVVIRDGAKKHVLQPLAKETFTANVPNARGTVYTHDGVVATFDLEQVIAMTSERGMDEFFVTVIGEGKTGKDFKIKRKHFKSLPGLAAIREE